MKGILDSIPSPSPSVKIRIMGRKVCLRCKGKTLDITQQCLALLPQLKFPANNLIFHWSWRWWDQIQAIFLNLFYFTLKIQIQTRSLRSVSTWVINKMKCIRTRLQSPLSKVAGIKIMQRRWKQLKFVWENNIKLSISLSVLF